MSQEKEPTAPFPIQINSVGNGSKDLLMKHEGTFSRNKRCPPRSPLGRAMMQEPGAEGDGFGGSQGWSEKEKMNRGCTTPPPFCNAMISTLSKYFHLLIKTILVRSVGRELLLITARK